MVLMYRGIWLINHNQDQLTINLTLLAKSKQKEMEMEGILDKISLRQLLLKSNLEEPLPFSKDSLKLFQLKSITSKIKMWLAPRELKAVHIQK
jgi:hypothetical protein